LNDGRGISFYGSPFIPCIPHISYTPIITQPPASSALTRSLVTIYNQLATHPSQSPPSITHLREYQNFTSFDYITVLAMSNTSTPAKAGPASPTITPLHDPAHQAKVIKPAPLGTSNRESLNPLSPSLFFIHNWKCLIKAENAHIVPGQDTTGAAGLGVKALLAKKMAKAK
jgi:hypothetical protein